MNEVTSRQLEVLSYLVREYVKTAVPVSSQLIGLRCMPNLSPATIRNEMRALEEAGFLLQPHTSAGRIPTEEGYRALVRRLDALAEERLLFPALGEQRLVARALRALAARSSSLAVAYLADQELVWKEGWEELLSAPEFSSRSYTLNFMRFLRDVERGLEHMEPEDGIRIFIGRKNPFSRSGEFSIILGSYQTGEEDGACCVVALAGPMRMAYDRNISLLCRLGRDGE